MTAKKEYTLGSTGWMGWTGLYGGRNRSSLRIDPYFFKGIDAASRKKPIAGDVFVKGDGGSSVQYRPGIG